MHKVKILYPGDRSFETAVPNDVEHNGLEEVWESWNAGSGSQDFLAARCRSLSVGDYVAIDGKWYRCEACGWREMTEKDALEADKKVRELVEAKQYPSAFSASHDLAFLDNAYGTTNG